MDNHWVKLIDRLIESDRVEPKHICILGDPMTDVYVHGDLHECQDGCQKIVERERTTVPGGASNAYEALRHWNAERWFPFKGYPGPIKTRLMVDGKCLLRHDVDDHGFDYAPLRAVIPSMFVAGGRIDAVLISDYDKGAMDEEFIRRIIVMCQRRHIPCVVDAKRPPALYRGAILKSNAEYAEKYMWDVADISVITRGYLTPVVEGDHGAASYEYIRTPLVECVNHVGAGDCFAAHLALALAHGCSLKDAAAVAHAAGRVYVGRPHNAAPAPAAIRGDMMRWEWTPPSETPPCEDSSRPWHSCCR